MRIGIFGGSFDPIHLGHLVAADAAADALDLGIVLFVPAALQPFKLSGASEAQHRVAMLQLALKGNPRFRLDKRELDRGGISYTHDTLKDLRRDFPGDQLFLLVGADVAEDLPSWKNPESLAVTATIVALSRAGVQPGVGGFVDTTVTIPSIGISASGVREAVRSGRSIRYLVPERVADYINAKRLYQEAD